MTQEIVTAREGITELLVDADRRQELREQLRDCPSWDLTPRQMCDLEMLMDGSFQPLQGFLGKADYDRVCTEMRLGDGMLWPIPIVLDVPPQTAEALAGRGMLALRDPEGVALAVLHIEEIWQGDREAEAEQVYGTASEEHPGVRHLMQNTHACYVGGRIEGLELPTHHDFVDLRLTPRQVRERFAAMGWQRVVAFQTRNPMHRAHLELTFRAAREIEASLLIHPVVGMTKPGDVDHYTRVRCYQLLMNHYPHSTAMLSLLPLAMRMAGPREALWHAIIRRNHGCTHFIVGRDHAGPGGDGGGKAFYGPYDAQELLKEHEREVGIRMVPFRNMVYIEDRDQYVPSDEVPLGVKPKSLSGTELRDRLARGAEIPAWFSFPEVVTELRRSYPPRAKQGFTVFFTGLPSSGKSTLANVLRIKLLEMGGRPVTVLDGDLVRKNLSSELGFSKEHRDLNIRRIGYVAAEITRSGGIAICAPIAPYDKTRKDVRSMVAGGGGFILVHVATPIETCEQRDRKGLFAKARAGIVKEFTGVSDPYETPDDADLTIDTTTRTADQCVQSIILFLEKEGYIGLDEKEE